MQSTERELIMDKFYFSSTILFNVLLALVILYAYIKTKNIGYLLFLIPLFILPFLIAHPLKSTLINESKFYFANRGSITGDDLIRLSDKMYYHRNALKIIPILQTVSYVISFYVLLKISISKRHIGNQQETDKDQVPPDESEYGYSSEYCDDK